MNYASTNEPENYKPMTLLDAEGMETSVSDYMQSDEYKQKLAGKQEDKVSKELGTREHYEEYVRNCEDAGIMPVSWASWEIQYPQPVASAPASVEDTFHAKLIAGASSITPVYTPERIEQLEAENARLQSELDAARAIIVQAGVDMQTLRLLQKAVEAFVDDYGDWSPKQRYTEVSSDAIKALMNALPKSDK